MHRRSSRRRLRLSRSSCGVWKGKKSARQRWMMFEDCQMIPRAAVLALLVTLLPAAVAQSVSTDQAGFRATFAASNGDVIGLDTRTGTLNTPRSRSTGLRDCSDKFQVCLSDDHGFAFAYFRKCDDPALPNYKSLKFPPKVVSVLHNDHVWLVFDASPNYLFHYSYLKGIVGIYLGPTADFDFRSVLRDRNFQLADLDSMEFRITGSGTVAACSE